MSRKEQEVSIRFDNQDEELELELKKKKSLFGEDEFMPDRPQKDYYSWSIGSIFLCFIWGILAYMSSNKVREYNKRKDYVQAAKFSRLTHQHNISALACFVVLICILGIPYAIALAVQGSITNYPSAKVFFG
jgi:hypothetical protein